MDEEDTLTMPEPSESLPFRHEVQSRFLGTCTSPGGEAWVRHEDAVATLDLAHERGLRLLGMEGFVVGEHVYPSVSRIADFSGSGGRDAYDDARARCCSALGQRSRMT